MAESFSVTRRFFDDKNYPRGFSRHGDYTIKESQVLEQYGQAFKALESGEREPVTKKKKLCCILPWRASSRNLFEKTWSKYRARISTTKRVYTLSGVVGTDNLDDFSAE